MQLTPSAVARHVRIKLYEIAGRPIATDYREELFRDLQLYAGSQRLGRILEIGPKDGRDTKRLAGLVPDSLTVVDLPQREQANEQWLAELREVFPPLDYVSANIMYDQAILNSEPFDCVWCTGVLYHNPEQLRMVRLLFDCLAPSGILVIESATTRIKGLQKRSCVEVVYPPSQEYARRYHISQNITHVPSRRALQSWLEMVGFRGIQRSACHRRVGHALARHRAAFLCRRPVTDAGAEYYAIGGEGYPVGRAL